MKDSFCWKAYKYLDMQENSINSHNFHSMLYRTYLHQKQLFNLQILKESMSLERILLWNIMIRKKLFGNLFAQLKSVQFNGNKKLMRLSVFSLSIRIVVSVLLLNSINSEVETLETEVLLLSHLQLIIVLQDSMLKLTLVLLDSMLTLTLVLPELKQIQTLTTEWIMMTKSVEVSMTTQDPKPIKQDSDKLTIMLVLQLKLKAMKLIIKSTNNLLKA